MPKSWHVAFYWHRHRNVQVLEAELSNFKDKVTVILEKSVNDDKLIAALRAEVNSLRKGDKLPDHPASSGRSINAGSSAGVMDEETWQELVGLRRRVRELEGHIDRQEQIVLALSRGSGAAGGAGSGSQAPPSAPVRASVHHKDELAREQIMRLREIERAGGTS